MARRDDTLPHSASDPGSRLPVINGLRGVAIIGVLFNHIFAGMFAAEAVPTLLSPLLTNGWSGVNLFFILSGFVLFLPYEAGDRAMASAGDRLDFYRRRCRRLLPLFYLGAVVSWALAVGVRGQPADPGQLLAVLSGGFIVDATSFGPSFNIALWSLGDEIAFSVLFPFLILGVRRYGAIRFAALALVLSLAMRLAGISRFPAVQGVTFNSDMFLCRLDEFVLGMAVAQAYAAGWVARRPALWAAAGAVLVLAAWTGFDLVLRGEAPPPARAVLNDVLDAGFVALVLAALAPRSRGAAVLSWRPLQLAGMMCFSLYVWHYPLLEWIAPDRATLSAGPFAVAVAAFLGLTLAVAALSYRFVEFPKTRDWRRMFLLPRLLPRPAEP